jgi:CRP-like cAMP-binding protein
MQPDASRRNSILSALSAEDVDLLGPMETVDLPLRFQLSQAHRKIDRVYFLESGIASTTMQVRHEVPVEIGVTGREGVVNLPFLIGSDMAPSDTYMQIGGRGRRVASETLRRAMRRSESLTLALTRSAHVFLVQISSTVLSSSRATIPERLARWLLMAHDRVDGDVIRLTHDLLATMLGVQRPGVTAAMRDFERRGLVLGGRGEIRLLDREALETVANGYYGVAEAEFRRVFQTGQTTNV